MRLESDFRGKFGTFSALSVSITSASFHSAENQPRRCEDLLITLECLKSIPFFCLPQVKIIANVFNLVDYFDAVVGPSLAYEGGMTTGGPPIRA